MNNMKTLGAIAIIMGIIALFTPLVTGLSIAFLVGVLVTIVGIIRLVWAFQARSRGSMFLMFAIGVLTLACGIAMLSNSLFATAVLTILVAVYFVVDGVLELAAGLVYGFLPERAWLIIAGVISIIFGIVLLALYPLSGAWALGILFGIKLIFTGVIMLRVGAFPETKGLQ